jgi:hypothetical protein
MRGNPDGTHWYRSGSVSCRGAISNVDGGRRTVHVEQQ